jgi:hypothetical protein
VRETSGDFYDPSIGNAPRRGFYKKKHRSAVY